MALPLDADYRAKPGSLVLIKERLEAWDCGEDDQDTMDLWADAAMWSWRVYWAFKGFGE